MQDYNARITCPVPADRAYRAITEEMTAWWTPMTAPFLQTGDKAKTNFGGEGYWVFEATTLNQYNLIELTCCEANYQHPDMTPDMKEEWLDTTLKFDISETNGETAIEFTHQGLTSDMGCYDVCRSGWDHYFLGSLQNYLNKNQGQPNSY